MSAQDNAAQTLLDAIAAAGISPQQLAQALLTQGVLVNVATAPAKVTHVTADGRTIQVTPKQKARFDAQAQAKAANPRPANTFYQDVIVGGREKRATRKANNKTIADALDTAQPGWRKLDAVTRAQVWETAKAAATQV